MTDVIAKIGLREYSPRPISGVGTAPPYAALVSRVLLGMSFIVLAPRGAPRLAEACSMAICGP
jgi:hypothetical protein